ncbi:MAG: ATP-binding protein [Spirosomaceae bacterium]|nr:ATP-binding protein [Spirosomataceae bacterium]
MLHKPLQQITYHDLEDFIHNQKIGEGHNLDFKGEPKNIDEFANKLLKVFSSFANSGGGHIIIGVEEIDKLNKGFEIKGINPIVNSKNVIEWINQMINGNIEPKIFFYDPHTISIPDSDRIVVVYRIPESHKKPHFNNRDCKYYIRQNDSSEPAKHHTIRDMFEFSRRRNEDLNHFLESRKLLKPESDDFALTKLSNSLNSEVFTKEFIVPKPVLVISFIPAYLNQENRKIQNQNFRNWIEINSKGHNPNPNISLFSTTKTEYHLEGITLKNYREASFSDFLINGYFEVGLCDSLFWSFEDKWKKQPVFCLHITFTIGYLMSLLHFSKKYYEYFGYDEEILLQLSFRSVLNFHIEGFNQTQGRREWRDYINIPKNKNNNNFKIIDSFVPSSLTDDSITNICQEISAKILLAFGINDPTVCFINDNIDKNVYSGIRHL